MPRIDHDTNTEVPETLGEYLQVVTAFSPWGKYSKAAKFLEGKIAEQGIDQKVIAPDSQMRAVLFPMMTEPYDERFTALNQHVHVHAADMLEKLIENVDKGGWDNDTPRQLYDRAAEELEEVHIALYNLEMAQQGEAEPGKIVELAEAVIRELADVSNFNLMVADKMRQIIASKTEGANQDAV